MSVVVKRLLESGKEWKGVGFDRGTLLEMKFGLPLRSKVVQLSSLSDSD